MLFLLLLAGLTPTLLATPGEDSLDRFLALDTRQPDYRGTRHLEAENGTPNSLSRSAACCIVSQSVREPMMMPTRGRGVSGVKGRV